MEDYKPFFIVLADNHEATHGLEGYKFVRYATERQAWRVAAALQKRYGGRFYVLGVVPEPGELSDVY